jgi:recombination protein RecA
MSDDLRADAKALVAALNKKYGAGTVVRGSDCKQDLTPRVTSGSVTLDYILLGGWPSNQWNMLLGEQSHGKSMVALKTVAANQARDPEWLCVWVAAEQWVSEYAELCGVDVSRVVVVETNIMEEAYDIAISFAESRAVDCIVIDSLPALVPSSEDDKAMDEATVGRGALLTNKFFRKVGKAMKRSLTEDERPVLGILINQYREKIGVMHGDPRTWPGGKGMNFAMFSICEVKRDDWIEAGTGNAKERVGQTTRIRTLKFKAGPPQRTAYVDFYFDSGGPCRAGDYDFAKEVLALGIHLEVVTRKGAWYYYGDRKWQGTEAALSDIREDVDLFESLRGEVLK